MEAVPECPGDFGSMVVDFVEYIGLIYARGRILLLLTRGVQLLIGSYVHVRLLHLAK